MEHFFYPTSLADIDAWCRARKFQPHEARERFMEFVVLECIARNRILAEGLVFKGGNALRFVYDSPRSTTDLDFTADTTEIPDDPEALLNMMDSALKHVERHFGVKVKCQSIKRNPKKPDATRPTFRIRIGYQFRTDRYYHSFAERDVSTVVKVEISISDIVCETAPHLLVEQPRRSIQVCTLEDILAEKLRALLQQPIRKRHRKQDVYDIARFTTQSTFAIEKRKIAEFLVLKAAAREIEVRRSAFDDEVRSMAEFGYSKQIQKQSDNHFIPFDDAWEAVLALVNSLDLPD